jgi:hypothetical protein
MSGMAEIHVHAVSCNERELMPYFMAHYRDFVNASRIVVHYDDSTIDGSDELARKLGAETIHHERKKNADGAIPLDDSYLRDLRSAGWHSSRGRAEWVIIVDIDELVIHPDLHALLDGAPAEVRVLQAEGWELVGDWRPEKKQIWQSVRRGATEPFYSKACVFRPEIDMFFSIGSHEARPTLNGQPVEIYAAPQLKLLHCHYLGLDFVLRRQAMKRGRAMSDLNEQYQWGAHWRESDELLVQRWNDAQRRAVPIPDLPSLSN